MLSLSGHIGAKVAALVDGQLSPAEEERAWSHVLACPGCRRAVEHEGWTKRQLGSLSRPATVAPPPQLLGSLYAVDAWATPEEIESRSRRRRTTAAVVGGGAVGACVLGLITVTGGPAGLRERPAAPSQASIRGGTVGTPAVAPGTHPTSSSSSAETEFLPIWLRRSR